MEHLRMLMTQQQNELQELFSTSAGYKQPVTETNQYDTNTGEVNSDVNKQSVTETRQYVPGNDDKEVSSPHNESPASQQDEDVAGQNLNEETIDSDDSDVCNQNNMSTHNRNDIPATDPNVQSLSHSKGMTTWSDIKGQRSTRPADERTLSEDHLLKDSVAHQRLDQDNEAVSRSYLEELKSHYKKVWHSQ